MYKIFKEMLRNFFADLNDILFFRHRRGCRYCGGGHCAGLCAQSRQTPGGEKDPPLPGAGRNNGAGGR